MDDRRRSGFTLSELLVTLAVIALLAGIAVPSMAQHLDKARLRAASTALAHELEQARSHAINHRKTVYFSFVTGKQRACFGWSDRAPCDCNAHHGDAHCTTGDGDSRYPHHLSLQDFPSVELSVGRARTTGTLQFAALRGTATAASFLLQSRLAQLKVILSPLGRVRSCSPDGKGYPSC